MKSQNEIIQLGIKFAKTLNADNESYLAGAAFGYSCGYEAAQTTPSVSAEKYDYHAEALAKYGSPVSKRQFNDFIRDKVFAASQHPPVSGYSREQFKQALHDALNQGYYSFLHPDIFPPTEADVWISQYMEHIDKGTNHHLINDKIQDFIRQIDLQMKLQRPTPSPWIEIKEGEEKPG